MQQSQYWELGNFWGKWLELNINQLILACLDYARKQGYRFALDIFVCEILFLHFPYTQIMGLAKIICMQPSLVV